MMHRCFLVVFVCALFSSCGYKQVHRNAFLVDTHNDLLSSVTLEGLNIEEDLRGKSHSDLKRLKKGGVDLQVFSIFCDETYGNGTAYNRAIRELDSITAIANRNPSKIKIISDNKEIRKDAGYIQALMGVEGGHMIEDDLSKIDSFYNRGARYMTLTWNNSTSWATSAKDESLQNLADRKYGLNEFGEKVVKRMNELGMIVDVSHVGERTFWDVMRLTTKPVIASHSSVYALCPVFRNLKDDQIKAIAKNGGVIHINFFSGFLDSTYKKGGPRADFSLVIDHINYIVKLVGVDHVGIGSDFDGIESTPKELDGVEDFPLITKALLKEGYSKQDINKILGDNFLRVLAQQ
jgi:membrane dipeptidase